MCTVGRQPLFGYSVVTAQYVHFGGSDVRRCVCGVIYSKKRSNLCVHGSVAVCLCACLPVGVHDQLKDVLVFSAAVGIFAA